MTLYFSTDRSGLEDPSRIESLQEPVLEALKHYVRSRRKDHPQVFANLLMKLTDLRSISVKGKSNKETGTEKNMYVYTTMRGHSHVVVVASLVLGVLLISELQMRWGFEDTSGLLIASDKGSQSMFLCRN